MTDSDVAAPASVPNGIRVASTLCYIVGVLSGVVTLAIGLPLLATGAGLLTVVVGLGAAVLCCAAGYFVRQQKRAGGLLVVLAWAFPIVVSLAVTGKGTGNFLLFVALLFTAANWKHLR